MPACLPCLPESLTCLSESLLPTVPLPPAHRSMVGMLSYNALASKEPAERWQARLRWLARLLGCYNLLTNPPQPGKGEGNRGGDNHDR